MYCKNCGKEIGEVFFCPNCGASQKEGTTTSGFTQNKVVNPNDTGNNGWLILGFFIPLIGLILYLIWSEEQTKNAKKAGKGALIGAIVSVVLSIVSSIIWAIFLRNVIYCY